jgi:hypothetical protein
MPLPGFEMLGVEDAPLMKIYTKLKQTKLGLPDHIFSFEAFKQKLEPMPCRRLAPRSRAVRTFVDDIPIFHETGEILSETFYDSKMRLVGLFTTQKSVARVLSDNTPSSPPLLLRLLRRKRQLTTVTFDRPASPMRWTSRKPTSSSGSGSNW